MTTLQPHIHVNQTPLHPSVTCRYTKLPAGEAHLSMQLRWRAVALQALHAHMGALLASSAPAPDAVAQVRTRIQGSACVERGLLTHVACAGRRGYVGPVQGP